MRPLSRTLPLLKQEVCHAVFTYFGVKRFPLLFVSFKHSVLINDFKENSFFSKEDVRVFESLMRIAFAFVFFENVYDNQALMQHKTLKNIETLNEAKILQIEGEPHFQTRLSELGFHAGKDILLVHKIPFGGPYIIQIDDSLIALREEEAQCIQVTQTNL